MVAALTALYMGHCKVLERVRPFIEAGGLRSLVALIDHPNLHIASQAMNSLLLITDGVCGAVRMGQAQGLRIRVTGGGTRPLTPSYSSQTVWAVGRIQSCRAHGVKHVEPRPIIESNHTS